MRRKIIDDVGCNIWIICLKLNWFFTIRVVYCNFLNLYGGYVLQYKSFLTIFSLKTQQIEVRLAAIISDYCSPYENENFSSAVQNENFSSVVQNGAIFCFASKIQLPYRIWPFWPTPGFGHSRYRYRGHLEYSD